MRISDWSSDVCSSDLRVAWGFGRMIDRELTRRGIETRSHMEVDSLEAIFSLVLHGLGVAIAPQRWIRRPLPEGIRSVPFGDPPLTRTIGILQARDNPRSEPIGSSSCRERLCPYV